MCPYVNDGVGTEPRPTVFAVLATQGSGNLRDTGLIAVADTIRPEASALVELHDIGIEEIVMLTGDNPAPRTPWHANSTSTAWRPNSSPRTR